MILDLEHIAQELQKRWKYSYKWYRKQNDTWDGYTNFIYHTQNWESLIENIANVVAKHNLDKHEIFYYTINRWYNFWSAKAIENMFTQIEGVTPVKNQKDRHKDFYIQGKAFDHKTSVFPMGFGKSFDYAYNNPLEVIAWLYEYQSNQQRYHLNNRLYIIVYDKNGAHWKIKAKLGLIKTQIEKYCTTYHEEQLQTLTFATNKKTYSDIIWVIE